jgi:uncharacterized caspase-like protein
VQPLSTSPTERPKLLPPVAATPDRAYHPPAHHEPFGCFGKQASIPYSTAAHGYSHQGRFYLIPQDYQGGTNPEALKSLAIGQERLQDWITDRIKAKMALILLDTCESGALTSGYSRSWVDDPAADASIGRLHEATGRPVLTAAAQGESALEFPWSRRLKHGLFTAALLDALHHSDANKDGNITLSSLVAHVQDLVPKLLKDKDKREALLARGEPAGGQQSVRYGSRGEDFAFVRRLPEGFSSAAR